MAVIRLAGNLTTEECFLQAELLLDQAESLLLEPWWRRWNREKKIIARAEMAQAYMLIASTAMRLNIR